MPRLLHMAARTIAKNFLALFLLFAVCAPYIHAAAEIGQHDDCGMEMCKRAGKCCCRRTHSTKPQWGAQDICHSGAAQLPGVFPPAALLGRGPVVHHLTLAAEQSVSDAKTAPENPLPLVRFQRPPPPSF